MSTLGDLFARVGLDISGFEKGWDKVNASLDKADKEMSKHFSGFDKLAGNLTSAGMAMSAAITLPLVGVGAAAIKVSEDLNMARLAFTTMLGDGQKAAAFLAELKTFAASTPFEFPDLVQAAKRMQAMGFEASQVVPTLRTIGDAAAALGGGKVFIDGVTTALGQMQAKGKVSAEEMNQLAERGVPAWKLLSDAIGVSIPEAMKLAEKGAIQAADAIPAILAGMNDQFGGQMQKASETLTGVWSNFKDKVTFALADMGAALTPAITALVTAALPLVEWAADAVKWFTELPAPIQSGAIAFAALAAAIGPILLSAGGLMTAFTSASTAIGVVATAIGISVTAFLGWAVAIAAAIAALVALGVWVNDNWGPIVAVVTQAWDGITDLAKSAWDAYTDYLVAVWEGLLTLAMAPFTMLREAAETLWDGVRKAWGKTWDDVGGILSDAWEGVKGIAKRIWEPIAEFFTEIWDAMKDRWQAKWNSIKSNLGSVWDSIKSMATTAWGAVTNKLKTFMEWVAKIPGMSKLFNLDDAWNSAKKLEGGVKDANTALGEHATKVNTAKTAHAGLVPKIRDTASAKVDANSKTATYSAGIQILIEKMKLEGQEYESNIKFLAKYQFELGKGHDIIANEMYKALDGLNERMGANSKLLHDQSSSKIPDLSKALGELIETTGDASKANDALAEAYKRLGVTSTQVLQQQAAQAQKDYDLIKSSGTASARDIEIAWVKMEKARQEAAKASGQIITKEQSDTLAQMEAKLGESTTKQKGMYDNFSREVSTIITNFAQSISKTLWEGDTSWGEKGKKILKDLGQAVSSSFIQPATQAISNFISGAISDLLSGRGLGGIMDRIKGIGDALTNVFNQAGRLNTAVPGATGGAGGGMPGMGGGGSAGWMGGINMVTGGISAVSGVISNFQNAKMETTLNAIEANTRFATIMIGQQPWSVMENTAKTREFLGYANASLDTIKGDLPDIGENLRLMQDHTFWSLKKLETIDNSTFWGLETLKDIARNLKGEGGGVVMNFEGVTPQTARTLAQAMGTSLATQRVFA